MDTKIRPASERDAAELADIYNYYISNTYMTFEIEPVVAEQMARRVAETIATSLPWLIAEASGEIVGYAYATKWKGRRAYRYSVESTIYMDPGHTQRGIGVPLYSALVDTVRSMSIHSLIGGIALPNEGSIRLHERLGFEKVGHFQQVGYKFGQWVDVGYWQLLLQK